MLRRRDFLRQSGYGIGGTAIAAVMTVDGGISVASADEPVPGKIIQPAPYAVIQRKGFEPAHAHEHEPGGPKLGFADIPLIAEFLEVPRAKWQFRTVALPNASGATTEWVDFEPVIKGKILSATVRVRAGGWYRLEVRATAGEKRE